MWAPSAVNHFSIATHVFTVEFHCYVYHLLDVLPEFSPLPHLSEKSKDFDKFELEPIEITVRRTDGSTSTHTDIMFPKRFGEVRRDLAAAPSILFLTSEASCAFRSVCEQILI